MPNHTLPHPWPPKQAKMYFSSHKGSKKERNARSFRVFFCYLGELQAGQDKLRSDLMDVWLI